MRVAHYSLAMGPQSASRRLQISLRDVGVDAWSVVRDGACDDIRQLPQSTWGRYGRKAARKLEHLLLHYGYNLPMQALWSSASFGTPATAVSFGNPDILHLHWIAAGALGLASMARLHLPVIWTMHDTWPFTAGCHIRQGCEKYRTGCEQCHFFPAQWLYDYAAAQFRARRKAYAAMDVVAVSPSKSYQEKARASSLLRDIEVHYIPNGIDTNLFKPIDRNTARRLLDLPESELVVLSGAVAVDERHKGMDLAVAAMRRVAAEGIGFTHINFGGGSLKGMSGAGPLPFPSLNLGRLFDQISVALAYAAADLFICPSREESFSQTTLESLACGTPVVAFSVGGIPDMVAHGISGILAPIGDVDGLAQGLAMLLQDEALRRRMGSIGREIVVRHFSAPVIARQYIALYERVLEMYRKKDGNRLA